MTKTKFSRFLPFRKPLYFYVTWSLWSGIIYFAMLGYSPTVMNKTEVKKVFMFVFPQGWGFFTRSPQEVMTIAYKEEENTLHLVTTLNASADNYLGLSRKSRVIASEMFKITAAINDTSWKSDKGSLKSPAGISDTITLSQKFHYFESGVYIFHRHKTIPFAWANQDQEKHLPYQVAKVYIN